MESAMQLGFIRIQCLLLYFDSGVASCKLRCVMTDSFQLVMIDTRNKSCQESVEQP